MRDRALAFGGGCRLLDVSLRCCPLRRRGHVHLLKRRAVLIRSARLRSERVHATAMPAGERRLELGLIEDLLPTIDLDNAQERVVPLRRFLNLVRSIRNRKDVVRPSQA